MDDDMSKMDRRMFRMWFPMVGRYYFDWPENIKPFLVPIHRAYLMHGFTGNVIGFFDKAAWE
jgi:hypothetical protein